MALCLAVFAGIAPLVAARAGAHRTAAPPSHSRRFMDTRRRTPIVSAVVAAGGSVSDREQAQDGLCCGTRPGGPPGGGLIRPSPGTLAHYRFYAEPRGGTMAAADLTLSNPIINSPYDPPDAHFEIGPTGPTGRLLQGRRPSPRDRLSRRRSGRRWTCCRVRTGWRASCAAGSWVPGWAGRACRWTSGSARPSRPGVLTELTRCT